MADRFAFDSPNETLILTTKNGEQIGYATRRECHQGKGKTHWAILAIIKRSNGDIVLACRSAKKSVFPDIWDASVASHVLRGDMPSQTAFRETKEELGIDVDFQEIGSFYYFHRDGDHAENEYCTLLVGVSDQPLSPNTAEVSQVQEMSYIALLQNTANTSEKYSPWLRTALKQFGQDIRAFPDKYDDRS